MRLIVEAAIKDGAEKKGKKITLSLHHLQVQNDLLQHENNGLRHALTTKEKHKKKSKALDLQQRKEYNGGAVFWSPSKIREARAREQVRAPDDKELKAQAALYKKKIAEEKRVGREIAKVEREKEKERKAAERAEIQRKKQQEKEAATAQKSLQLSQRGKRAASQKAGPKAKRARVAHAVEGGGGGGKPALSPPPKVNSRGRKINLPKKFK
ncbi:hypothetical protein CC80DRAFT_496873 [Byssothecium circinans]|uniref:TolA, Membrane protein involved in colicin uptake n=1 Tax=Byssothecium circinans TaxID=147558 RepID=A0A6A5TFN4_9PLEO|nr:hypothetical protein CC80DRAFT_496873 [Byssothecium circinans]